MNFIYPIKIYTDSLRYISSSNNFVSRKFAPSDEEIEISNETEEKKVNDVIPYKLNQFLYDNIKKNKFLEKQQMKKSKIKFEEDKGEMVKITDNNIDIFKDDVFTVKSINIDDNGEEIKKTSWAKLDNETKRAKIECFLKLYVDYSYGEEIREEKRREVDELLENEKNLFLLIKNVKYDKNNERVSTIKGFYPKKNKFIFEYQNEFHNQNLFF
jgi:hypothetical protein